MTLDGTVETGSEQSAFFPDGDCSRKPFWFRWPDERDYDMNARILALRFPDALRVKLIANVSRLGTYGHLGAYPREVWPIKIISVNPAPPCWPGRHKPDWVRLSAASNELLQALIGEKITISGTFSLWGKVGPYLSGHDRLVVYLRHRGTSTWGKPYSQMDGKLVAATGTLRFYHALHAEPTDQPLPVAQPFDYFYLEVETTQLRLIEP